MTAIILYLIELIYFISLITVSFVLYRYGDGFTRYHKESIWINIRDTFLVIIFSPIIAPIGLHIHLYAEKRFGPRNLTALYEEIHIPKMKLDGQIYNYMLININYDYNTKVTCQVGGRQIDGSIDEGMKIRFRQYSEVNFTQLVNRCNEGSAPRTP